MRLDAFVVPTLFLTVGLPGSGKTTAATRIERERNALRLTADEWLGVLFGHTCVRPTDGQRQAVEMLQWQVAVRVLRLGRSVVLDWGLWSRLERDELRQRAAAIPAKVVLVYDDVPQTELRARLARRIVDPPIGMFEVSEQDLELWVTWFEPPSPDELHDVVRPTRSTYQSGSEDARTNTC